MELIPVRPMWRSVTMGMAAGLVLVLAFVVWRAVHEDSVGATALAFGASAAACALLGLVLVRWRMPKTLRKAERAPDDAEIKSRKPVNWWFVFMGAGFALAAVTRSLDDDAIFAGVLTGMVAGGAVGFFLAMQRVTSWERSSGKELLMHRPGGFKKGGYYVRELGSARFDRAAHERELSASK